MEHLHSELSDSFSNAAIEKNQPLEIRIVTAQNISIINSARRLTKNTNLKSKLQLKCLINVVCLDL